MMLRQMLERIDTEGRRCYLEATPAGCPFYLKFAGKVVDEIRTGLAKYGGKNAPVELTPCMMRDASSTACALVRTGGLSVSSIAYDLASRVLICLPNPFCICLSGPLVVAVLSDELLSKAHAGRVQISDTTA